MGFLFCLDLASREYSRGEELALDLMSVFGQERITVVAPESTVMLERDGAEQSRVHDSQV